MIRKLRGTRNSAPPASIERDLGTDLGASTRTSPWVGQLLRECTVMPSNQLSSYLEEETSFLRVVLRDRTAPCRGLADYGPRRSRGFLRMYHARRATGKAIPLKHRSPLTVKLPGKNNVILHRAERKRDLLSSTAGIISSLLDRPSPDSRHPPNSTAFPVLRSRRGPRPARSARPKRRKQMAELKVAILGQRPAPNALALFESPLTAEGRDPPPGEQHPPETNCRATGSRRSRGRPAIPNSSRGLRRKKPFHGGVDPFTSTSAARPLLSTNRDSSQQRNSRLYSRN